MLNNVKIYVIFSETGFLQISETGFLSEALDKIGDLVQKPGFSLNRVSPNLRNRVSFGDFGQHRGFGAETRFLPNPVSQNRRNRVSLRGFGQHRGFGAETRFLPNPVSAYCVSPMRVNAAQLPGFGYCFIVLNIACLKAWALSIFPSCQSR